MANCVKKSNRKKGYRHSSSFYRKLKSELKLNTNCNGVNPIKLNIPLVKTISLGQCKSTTNSENNLSEISTDVFDNGVTFCNLHDVTEEDDCFVPESDFSDIDEESVVDFKLDFVQEFREWCLKHRITHLSINELMFLLRKQGINLPNDSRSLLNTPKLINIEKMGSGEYWYNGVGNCLKKLFSNIDEPLSISIIVNIDGLPPYRSSSCEFWPILFKITEIQQIKPMVVAIYCGDTKPPLANFLSQFVEEMKDILVNGVICNNQKVTVKINFFVCDTPARSFIKGKYSYNRIYSSKPKHSVI